MSIDRGFARYQEDTMKTVSISAALLAGILVLGCTTPEREYIPGPNPDLPFSAGVSIGNVMSISGHLGLDPDSGQAPADPAEEARLLLDAFAVTLEAGGMTMDDLIRVQVFCSDISLYGVFNAEYRTRFTGPFPARAFIGSGELLFGCRFEMLGTAARR